MVSSAFFTSRTLRDGVVDVEHDPPQQVGLRVDQEALLAPFSPVRLITKQETSPTFTSSPRSADFALEDLPAGVVAEREHERRVLLGQQQPEWLPSFSSGAPAVHARGGLVLPAEAVVNVEPLAVAADDQARPSRRRPCHPPPPRASRRRSILPLPFPNHEAELRRCFEGRFHHRDVLSLLAVDVELAGDRRRPARRDFSPR